MQSETIMVVDNRMNVSDKTVTLVTVSGTNITQLDTSSPEGANCNSSILWNNITTPNINSTLISRRCRARYTLTVTGTAAPPILDPGAALGANGANCCLRAFPLSSIVNSASIILNGSSSNIDLRSTLSATQRRIPKELLKIQCTECPCQADNAGCLLRDRLGTTLSSNNPLSSYYNSDGTTRASFQPVSFDGAQTYVYNVSEPFMISPFSLYENETYIPLINTLSINLNYTFLADMFVFGQGGTVPAGFAVTLSNPFLEMEYIQVDADVVKIPPMYTLPYENLIIFNRALPAMPNTNALATYGGVSTDNLRFSALPDLLYIFVRGGQITGRTGAPASASQTDSFLCLADEPNVSITLGNRSGLMSSCSLFTLYEISCRNGYNSSFADFSRGSGSLLIISPTKDLGLSLTNGDSAVGMSSSVNFQFRASYTNANYVQCTLQAGGSSIAGLIPEICVIPVFSGKCILSPSNCVFTITDLSQSELNHLLRTADEAEGSKVSSESVKPSIQGGSLFGSMKRIMSKVADGVRAVGSHPLVGQLADMESRGGLMSAAGLKGMGRKR